MDKYKLTFGVEPTDKYKKAKQDLVQALKSYSELLPQEKECLLRELFDSALIAEAENVFNKYWG